MNKIGDRIKQKRTLLGLSQDALAKRVGVARPTLTFWENNEKNPGSNYIVSLAESLGVGAEWLLTGIEPPEPDGQNISIATLKKAVIDVEYAALLLNETLTPELKATMIASRYGLGMQCELPAVVKIINKHLVNGN